MSFISIICPPQGFLVGEAAIQTVSGMAILACKKLPAAMSFTKGLEVTLEGFRAVPQIENEVTVS